MLGKFSRGDTIIEVMLAITIFSLVAMGTITIMNQGTNSAERALEVTQVKQQINSQAEALRAAQQAHLINPKSGDAWNAVLALQDQPLLSVDGSKCPVFSGKSVFVMNGHDGTYVPAQYMKTSDDTNAPPYARVIYDGNNVQNTYGLWIEKSTQSGSPGYFDFRVRACWYGPGLSRPMTLETVVRLYDA